METQDFDTVVATLKKRVVRDWLVGGLFAIGVVLNFAAVNVAVTAAAAAPTAVTATASAEETDPDAGLVVANDHATDQRVTRAQ